MFTKQRQHDESIFRLCDFKVLQDEAAVNNYRYAYTETNYNEHNHKPAVTKRGL